MMKKLYSGLAAMVLAASFAMPLSAMPLVVPNAEQAQTGDVQQVKYWNHGHGNGYAYGHWKNRRYAYRDCRYYGNCYRHPYYYGYHRYGYREYYGYRDYYPYHRRSGVIVQFGF